MDIFRAVSIYGICLIIIWFSSCTKNLQEEKIIYSNNFGQKPGTEFFNAKRSYFNGDTVLGRYATGGFELFLDNLGTHDLVQISFDLYIHDNWRGNNAASSNLGDADIWIMNIDGNSEKYTTFSNAECGSDLCAYQSYPNNFPFSNNPAKANASNTNLPGACALEGIKGGTVHYKIIRTTYHSINSLRLNCAGQLFNHAKMVDPLCDASWSIDNLVIKTIRFRD
jgi:hypothetical protein